MTCANAARYSSRDGFAHATRSTNGTFIASLSRPAVRATSARLLAFVRCGHRRWHPTARPRRRGTRPRTSAPSSRALPCRRALGSARRRSGTGHSAHTPTPVDVLHVDGAVVDLDRLDRRGVVPEDHLL